MRKTFWRDVSAKGRRQKQSHIPETFTGIRVNVQLISQKHNISFPVFRLLGLFHGKNVYHTESALLHLHVSGIKTSTVVYSSVATEEVLITYSQLHSSTLLISFLPLVTCVKWHKRSLVELFKIIIC